MPEILDTGGAGFIGSHAVDLFLDKGFEVVMHDLSTGCASSLNLRARFKIYVVQRDAGLELTAVHFRDEEQAV
jgi:UDP-glucose 4-epimerase